MHPILGTIFVATGLLAMAPATARAQEVASPPAPVVERRVDDTGELTPRGVGQAEGGSGEADAAGGDEAGRRTSSDVLDDLMRERDPLLDAAGGDDSRARGVGSPSDAEPMTTPIPPTRLDLPPATQPIEPRQPEGSIPSRVNMPAPSVDLDPAILGVAPDAERPKLRREGDLVVQRRGRLLRSSDGEHVMLVFDVGGGGGEGGGAEADEPPMILMPSRLLEQMEDLVQRRGDETVFVVSGQVHAYRGANYLLPTTMEVARGGDNLKR